MHPAGAAPDDQDPLASTDAVPARELARVVTYVGRRDGWDAAAAVIGDHWDRYATTQPRHLLAAIAALPGDVLLSNSGLVVGANYLRQVAADTAPHRFDHDRRFSAFPTAGSESLAEQLILLTGAAARARTDGDVDVSREAAKQGRRVIDQALRDGARAAEVEAAKRNLPHLFVQWGRSLEVSDSDGAAYEYEEAHHLALVTEQPQIARRAAGHLAWHHGERGRINTAADWVKRARAAGEPNPRYEATTHLAAALVLLEQGDRAGAGVELARARAYPAGEYWAGALWLRALHALSAAEITQVETELAGEVERHGSTRLSPVDARYLRATRLTIGITHGDSPPRRATVFDRLLDAVEALASGAFREALEISREPAGDATVPRVRANGLLLSAMAALALDQRGAAEGYFRRAHAILEHEGMSTPFRILPPQALHDFATAIGRDISAEHRAEPAVLGIALSSLTKREREVLGLLATPASFDSIAEQLFISVNTVKTIAHRMYRKLNINSRREAAEIAHRAGIRRP